jgi:5-methylcytosine-specific restriction endonuclease McrA
MDIAEEICKKLGLEPRKQLKRSIRGLLGYTIYDLINAIIYTDNIEEAATQLGYTLNPVKQSIRETLLPYFSNRVQKYGIGGGHYPWRIVLLDIIDLKRCSKCKVVLTKNEFHSNSSNRDNLAVECKICKIIQSKINKIYIKERTPIWADLDKIYEFYFNCPIGYQVDHIIPLKGKLVSGLHVLNNLQYLTIEENLKKNNSYTIE